MLYSGLWVAICRPACGTPLVRVCRERRGSPRCGCGGERRRDRGEVGGEEEGHGLGPCARPWLVGTGRTAVVTRRVERRALGSSRPLDVCMRVVWLLEGAIGLAGRLLFSGALSRAPR